MLNDERAYALRDLIKSGLAVAQHETGGNVANLRTRVDVAACMIQTFIYAVEPRLENTISFTALAIDLVGWGELVDASWDGDRFEYDHYIDRVVRKIVSGGYKSV